MNFAKRERAELCDLFVEVGPDAPTLNKGWTTHDLAAHLWVRENDPLALPGIGISAFSGLTDQRMDRAKRKFSYRELVRRLRNPNIVARNLDPVNMVEYFIHHEDVLRATTLKPVRTLPISDEDALWRPLSGMAIQLKFKARTGLVLERSDDPGSMIRVKSGSQTVTVLAPPSELALWLSGRGQAAVVEFIGTPDAVATLDDLDLGL